MGNISKMWPFRRFPRLKVLVIGGVHLDTIIDVNNLNISTDPAQSNYTYYSSGHTIHSIGGTGFNIAENLARVAFSAKKEVGLYTILAKDSAITRIIRERLIGTRIYRDYVHELDYATSDTTAGGFVGVRDTTNARAAKTIRVAATDTPVNQTAWAANAAERAKLEGAIKNAEFIVAESYIEVNSATAIINFCEKYGKPLFVSLTSERSGAEFLSRAALAKPAYSISCRLSDLHAFSINGGFLSKVEGEVAALGNLLRSLKTTPGAVTGDADLGPIAKAICEALNAKHVVCADMQSLAYAFLSVAPPDSGSAIVKSFDDNIVARANTEGNLTGVRDGLFASFIHLSYRPKYDPTSKLQANLELTEPETQRRAMELASRYTGPIAQSRAATPGAVVSFAEQPVPWTFTVWRYLVLINEAAPLLFWALPILFLVSAGLLAWLGVVLDLPSPTEWRLPDWSKLRKMLGK